MRVNHVQKARKAQGACERCRTPISPGDPYVWIKPRYGGKRVRCTKSACRFRPSDMTSSDKLATIYGAVENVEDTLAVWDGPVSDITGVLEDAAQEVRGAGEEYEESASNMEEHFPGSYQVDEIREKAETAEEFAGQIEQVATEIESLEPDEGEEPTKPCPECGERRRRLASKAVSASAKPPEAALRTIRGRELEEGMVAYDEQPDNYVLSHPRASLLDVQELSGPRPAKTYNDAHELVEAECMVFRSRGLASATAALDATVQVLRENVRYRETKGGLWEWYDAETGEVLSDAPDVFPDCETCGGTGEVALEDPDEWREEVRSQVEDTLMELPL